MQNGAPNGTSTHDGRVTPEPNENLRVSSELELIDKGDEPLLPSNGHKDEDLADLHLDAPPSKRRKLIEIRRSTPRGVSPPWKKAGVEGPTSFIVEGRRKSSRTNAVPLDLQPPSAKRQTRATQKDYATKAVSSRKQATNSSPHAHASPRPGKGGRHSLGSNYPSYGSLKDASRGESTRKSSSRLSTIAVNNVSPSTTSKSATSRTRSYSSANAPGRVQAGVNNSSGTRRSRRNASISIDASPSAGQDFDSKEFYNEKDSGEFEGVPKYPRLRLKFKKGSVSVQHPGHVVAPKKHASFREWIDNVDVLAGENAVTTLQDAEQEALKRNRVFEAGEPGGLLTPQVCSACLPEPQEEPPQQYSHHDHLVAHALFFRKLLDQEHKRHRNTARHLAQSCAEAWRKRNKRPEDILREKQEEINAKRRQVIRDLQRQFDLVRAEVDRARLARWEEERKAENQQALNQAIKQSTMLFEKRRQEILGLEVDMDVSEDIDEDEDEDDDSSVSSEDESNMSSGESESESDGIADDDEALTAEELRLKYANLPGAFASKDIDAESSVVSTSQYTPLPGEELTENDVASEATSPNLSARNENLDDVDPVLLDASDESTDMDDDMGDSDMDSSEEQEDENDSDVDNSDPSDGEPGLLGFFSSKDRVYSASINDAGEESDAAEDQDDEVSLVPTGPPKESDEVGTVQSQGDAGKPTDGSNPEVLDSGSPKETLLMKEGDEQHDTMMQDEDLGESRHSGDASSEASPGTVATKPSEPDSVSSYETQFEKPSEPESAMPTGLKTPIPHLLRGTLREYQHYGVDWLAGLYDNNINGILADEMGLGKTIQTIALLAHLAVEKEVWGPHLVVVPTSVILNWEMEFKKWCPGFKIMTYYGNQEERKQKRRGWTDDSSWDVLITSYQLVLQDQQVLKRRNWHYMVLDEAHNIKNFRSQRWQALLTFKTRARLLLTGTPLQNNLTELWSLLFFLMPSDEDGAGVEGFADLRNFSEWFRRPVEQILEHGRETMDDEAKQIVTKLHTVLRPYLLRRLKADVEKQMPAKYEHVIYCRLSKRQRYLYDGFMSRAQTKETLSSGNYLSIINCLMQLRKVCNHPDLFETRQISTSFVMSTSLATDYETKEHLVRRRLLYQHPFDNLDLEFLNLAPVFREDLSKRLVQDTSRIMAFEPLKALRERQYLRTNWQMGFDGSSIRSTLESMENIARKNRMNELESTLYFESNRHGRRPVWGKNLIDFLTIEKPYNGFSTRGSVQVSKLEQLANQSSVLASMINSIEDRALSMEGYIQRFACVTPAATATGTTEAAITPIETRYFDRDMKYRRYDPFHEAQMRLSIAFPDKRLLQYDCGKLQQLDKLLRKLQAGGHRALIFTQMTKMLDILEQFLNIHGHRYLRLDGTTKVEQRQMLTDRFNNDNRILAFILSTRSGGLGINLTGADSVIFYDLDWNPAMDKQCQDRCHRIGQTRDVHIYRFVSEYTIESNILRKANQKRMLDDVVIQEGAFTTDYVNKVQVNDMIDEAPDAQDEASKAMDRVLDNRGGGTARVFEQAEDKEDIDAAKNAQKEMEHADDGDFEERSASQTPAQPGAKHDGTPAAAAAAAGIEIVDEEQEPNHIDEYLLRFMEWNLQGEPLVLPPDKVKKKSKRGKEHRLKRRR